MSLARKVATVVGVGIGVAALGFGLFADTSVVRGTLQPTTNGVAPAPVARTEAGVIPAPLESAPLAMTDQPPADAVIDREIDFPTPFVDQPVAPAPPAPPPMVLPPPLPVMLLPPEGRPVIIQSGGSAYRSAPATAAVPATGQPTISWSNPGKPGEPMVDPTPDD